MRRSLAGLIAIVLAAGCGSPVPPSASPTLSSTAGRPTGTATGSPAASPSPQASRSPAPATSGPVPTASARAVQPRLFVQRLLPLTFVTNAGDGSHRLFAVEQVGQIIVISADGSVVGQPFLDLRDLVSFGGERGLLGLAFHPDYAANGRFYVDYTDLDGNSVVAEFTRRDGATADPTSERVLLTVQQPTAVHNGGMLAFGPDGMLYVGLGDGGPEGDPEGNSQNPNLLLGKILRLDVEADPPAPPQIWDSGLRNPWRFSFDRQTGDLWIGDVGQGQHEEIDAEPAGTGGRNYGWNIMEGFACYRATTCDQAGLTRPVTSYAHVGGACSVIGGYVYRGRAMPALFGTYLYADYCSANVSGLDAAAVMAGVSVTPVRLGNVGGAPATFGEDEDGELYVADQGGRILALTSAPANPGQ
jgi:glucose/arabinose dehydrogenase